MWTREFLAQHEVEKLIEATKRNRSGRLDTRTTFHPSLPAHQLRAADCAGGTSDFKTATLGRSPENFGRCGVALDRKPPLELFAAVGAGDVEAPAGRGLRGLVASAPTDIYWTAAYRSPVDKWRCPFVHCSRAPSGYRIERLIFGCEGIVSNGLVRFTVLGGRTIGSRSRTQPPPRCGARRKKIGAASAGALTNSEPTRRFPAALDSRGNRGISYIIRDANRFAVA